MSAAPANESTIDQAWVIIRAKLRMGAHQVAAVRGESKLKVGVISVSAIGLWVGAFALLHVGELAVADTGVLVHGVCLVDHGAVFLHLNRDGVVAARHVTRAAAGEGRVAANRVREAGRREV